ncbi:hypothetical protein llap_13260 [Limosa lapponica baueri]|uniref:Uncharacterized protein n=1 Tax=Limosa lapponica baueri TaxID=1758121 RepID=A0A2I0TRK2_LIMLA|nr:hypothetical protein llap_13260 [Limosa lapponica baueri]
MYWNERAFCFQNVSPAGSSRYGSSCNVSQGSSHLSELDHSHESAHGSEQEDDHQERESNHSYQSSGSYQKDGQAWLREQEEPCSKGEEEKVCETEEKCADHSAAMLPLELEKPKDVDAGAQLSYHGDNEPPPFPPARAHWIRAISKVRLRLQECPKLNVETQQRSCSCALQSNADFVLQAVILVSQDISFLNSWSFKPVSHEL